MYYQITPNTTSTGLAPSEPFMNRRLRTQLDLLRRSAVERMKNYQEVTNSMQIRRHSLEVLRLERRYLWKMEKYNLSGLQQPLPRR